MPQRAHRLVLPAAALLAVLPLLLRGPSCGHDFDFHLLSWLEASTQFAHGAIPHWAFTPASNAGEPRFIFYPPISWTLGAVLGLILPWNLVPIAFTWIALSLAGLTFHAFARRFVPPPAALLAATLYLANPYMLFTAYERTAFAELLAAAFLPLLLAAALATRLRILPLALPLALIWLTNAPAAVMSTYALAFITLIRLLLPSSPGPETLRAPSIAPHALGGMYAPPCAPSIAPHAMGGMYEPRPRLRLALTTSSGTLLGLALAAFYILPAAYERRFVQINMVVIPGMRVTDHFLFHRMPGHTPDDAFHDAVVRTASWIAIGILAAIAALLVVVAGKPSAPASAKTPTPPILPLALLALLIAFLLTPLSLPLWNHLPELAFLQFPWRLTALLGAILATLAALALRHLPTSYSLLPIPCFLLVIVLSLPAYKTFQQPCDLEDAVPARVALFHSTLGTEATDEYTPIGADADALHPHDPPFWLIPATGAPDEQDAPAASASSPGPAPAHLTLSLPAPEILVLNRRQYPAWRISVNGHPVPPGAPRRDDGLIWVALPPGPHTIDLTLIRTPDQTAGLAISLTALAGVLATLLVRKRSLPSSQPTSPPRPPQPGMTRP